MVEKEQRDLGAVLALQELLEKQEYKYVMNVVEDGWFLHALTSTLNFREILES